MIPLHLLERSLRLDRFRFVLMLSIVTIVTVDSTLLFTMVERFGRLIILALATTSSSFSIFLILSELIRSSEENLSILRALGAKKSSLLLPILARLLVIGVAGVLIGLSLGIGLSFLGVNPLLADLLKALEFERLMFEMSYIIFSMISGVVIGGVVGVYHGWRR